MLPPTIECATKDQHPQTYDANVGRGYYFTKKYGDLHGVYVFTNDSRSGTLLHFASGIGGIRDAGGVNKGVRSDADLTIGAADAQRQDALTPAVQAIKTHDSNYAQCAIEYQCTVVAPQGSSRAGRHQPGEGLGLQRCYDKKFLPMAAPTWNIYVDTVPSLLRPEGSRRPTRCSPTSCATPARTTSTSPAPARGPRPSPSATPSTRPRRPTASTA